MNALNTNNKIGWQWFYERKLIFRRKEVVSCIIRTRMGIKENMNCDNRKRKWDSSFMKKEWPGASIGR